MDIRRQEEGTRGAVQRPDWPTSAPVGAGVQVQVWTEATIAGQRWRAVARADAATLWPRRPHCGEA